jgi:hypothetical protein
LCALAVLANAVPFVLPSAAGTAGAAAGPTTQWVASWTASPTDAATQADAAGFPVPQILDNQTLRMIVVPHLGGTVLRVHLSNRFGDAPVQFGDVTVGTESAEAAPTVSDITPVTFGGAQAVTIADGDDAVSDPVHLAFSAFEPLAISIYVPGVQLFPTKHWNANQTSLYSTPLSGNLSDAVDNSALSLHTQAWLDVDGVDVETPTSSAAIVAFGDSITDGFVASDAMSLPASQAAANTNGRYPDDLPTPAHHCGRYRCPW